MKSLGLIAATVAATAMLAGCGGGGPAPSDVAPPADKAPDAPTQPDQSQTHQGASLHNSDFNNITGPHAKPDLDLPPNGRDGLRITRPAHGHAPNVRTVDALPSLLDELEPGWRHDTNAQNRLLRVTRLLEAVTSKAYFQWTRHLENDPGPVTLVFGEQGIEGPCPETACQIPELDIVLISDTWLKEHYKAFRGGYERRVIESMFNVLTHEAGHEFGYQNPDGMTEGCTGDNDYCHDHYGSGSVMSYDAHVHQNVTEEDIRYIPDATWKSGDTDSYSVSTSANTSSIDEWGVWINHRFDVDGHWDSSRRSGDLSIVDEIAGTGWIRGKPSSNVALTGSATWSGEDNFLGVDLNDDLNVGQTVGALLRADANLRYTFGNSPNLALNVNNFEAHYAEKVIDDVCVSGVGCGLGSINADATWHEYNYSDWGDFTYTMDCTSSGCSNSEAEAKWYADDAGDPAGWVGGVVNDQANGYVGSFAAERD